MTTPRPTGAASTTPGITTPTSRRTAPTAPNSGWSTTLVHYGAGAYHDARVAHFKEAVRTAALRLRQTGKPVGLVVAHSSHAWVMTGFSATADPALDPQATITAVYVMGPLYLASRTMATTRRPTRA